ncbi:MAG: hypothetical protein JW763_06980 [candidate division Zixibacteria bacterium]|nr:hypothetical protein [candidate division Zixibacteria bacterium]
MLHLADLTGGGMLAGLFSDNLIDWLGGFGAVFMAVISVLAKRYLLPLLEIERRRRYATYIAAIADDVTDDLVQRYPDKEWLAYLDEAVDKIMEICEISPEVAERAAQAALARK